VKGRLFRAFVVVAATAAATIHMDPPAAIEPGRVAGKLASFPRAGTSFKGWVRVTAARVPGETASFHEPVLRCASDVVEALAKTFKLELARRARPAVFVYAQDGRTNDTRVVTRIARQGAETVTRIYLPSPAHADVETFRLEVARAFFRARTGGSELPAWLVQGALRTTDPALARQDRYTVLALWSAARLPFFPALCTDLRVAKGRGAALAGFVAGWMKEKRVFVAELDRLAAGGTWEGHRLAELLTGETEPARQDRAADEYLLALAKKVLHPGHSTPWDVQLFAARLLLYPPFFGKNDGASACCLTFREALGIAGGDPSLRAAAARRARELPLYAIGRGEKLQSASLAYREFLLALASGTQSPGALGRLLDEAEWKLRQVSEDGKDDNR